MSIIAVWAAMYYVCMCYYLYELRCFRLVMFSDNCLLIFSFSLFFQEGESVQTQFGTHLGTKEQRKKTPHTQIKSKRKIHYQKYTRNKQGE